LVKLLLNHPKSRVVSEGFRNRTIADTDEGPRWSLGFSFGIDNLNLDRKRGLVMTTTLYVGNLPWTTTDEELREAFSAYCDVKSTRIITDRETGRSRGFGFVEVDEADVARVVEATNGLQIAGREIVVNEARPRQDAGPRSRF
jgi:RNA recognition motif-containing protein